MESKTNGRPKQQVADLLRQVTESQAEKKFVRTKKDVFTTESDVNPLILS
jgi:hypothetical protein